MCELIRGKCFSEESSLSSSFNSENVNDRIFKVDNTEEFAQADCEFDGKISFSFSVLLEHGKKETYILLHLSMMSPIWKILWT